MFVENATRDTHIFFPEVFIPVFLLMTIPNEKRNIKRKKYICLPICTKKARTKLFFICLMRSSTT
jgi:hypothetical protein